MTAPFVIRYKTFSDLEIMPTSMGKGLKNLPNYGKWSEAVCAQESVKYVFDAEENAEGIRSVMKKLKAADAEKK